MIPRTLKSFLLVLAFTLLTGLYYWIIILVDKAMVYGTLYGLLRGVIIFSGYGYFWLLSVHVPLLDQVRRKINSYPSANNNGGIAVALTLGIVHMVLVVFGAERLHQYLLHTFGKVTAGVIQDCRQGREDSYCLYQYTINNKTYQVQLSNGQNRFRERDKVRVRYYPMFPVISKVEE